MGETLIDLEEELAFGVMVWGEGKVGVKISDCGGRCIGVEWVFWGENNGLG